MWVGILLPLMIRGEVEFKISGRDFYVDNERGDDLADGRSALLGEKGVGPVKTLAKAVSLLAAGDRLNLASNTTPYHETLTIRDLSGDTGRPIIIDGHGATLTGCEPLNPEEWIAQGDGLFSSDKLSKMLSTGGGVAANLDRIYFLFNQQIQHMGRTSKGRKAPFKRPEELRSGEWTYDAASSRFFVRVAGGISEANIEIPYRQNGVAIRGTKNAHLIIRNLVVTHVLNDGYNLHDGCSEVRFENIAAYECGDDGFSPHEACESVVDGYWASRNSTGFGMGNLAKTEIRNAHLEGNLAFEFLAGHSTVTKFQQSVIMATGEAIPILTRNAQATRLEFDDVKITSPDKGKITLSENVSFVANRLLVEGPSWEISGIAKITESTIQGMVLGCAGKGSWSGERNVYKIEIKTAPTTDSPPSKP